MSRFSTRRALAGSVLAAAALVGSAGVAYAAFGFDDVNEGDTHAAGIQWLVDNGVTAGCDADSYCPNQPVTRAQMATFMHRLSGHAAGVAASVDAETLGGQPSSAFVKNATVPTATMALNDDTVENVSVTCAGGAKAIAGGYQVQASQGGALSDEWVAAASRPTDAGTGWVASVRTIDGAAHDAFVTVYATCVS
jgi:hypothetical protein